MSVADQASSLAMWAGKVDVDPFQGTHKLFSTPEMTALAPSAPHCIYDFSAEFFAAAAAAMRLAKGGLRIEMVLGDAFAMMDRVSASSCPCPRQLMAL
jgi:hypothetical protein